MAIILRKLQSFPVMRPDGSFTDVPHATIAFIDANGQQYSQLNIPASEVEGIPEGAALRLIESDEPHGPDVSDDHAEMITPQF
jgi:hypothetical protein